MTHAVEIVEVGPRDGLQNEKATLDPVDRAAFVTRLEECGARRIEAVSFVNPARVPQMADAEAVMAALPARHGVSRIGLVLNRRGWSRAVASGCDEVNLVVCASDDFGVRNQGATTQEQIAGVADIIALRAAHGGPPLSLTVAVAF